MKKRFTKEILQIADQHRQHYQQLSVKHKTTVNDQSTHIRMTEMKYCDTPNAEEDKQNKQKHYITFCFLYQGLSPGTADLGPMSFFLLPQPPQQLGSQVCTTTSGFLLLLLLTLVSLCMQYIRITFFVGSWYMDITQLSSFLPPFPLSSPILHLSIPYLEFCLLFSFCVLLCFLFIL